MSHSAVSADSTNAAAAVAQAAIQKNQAVKHYHKQVSRHAPIIQLPRTEEEMLCLHVSSYIS